MNRIISKIRAILSIIFAKEYFLVSMCIFAENSTYRYDINKKNFKIRIEDIEEAKMVLNEDFENNKIGVKNGN